MKSRGFHNNALAWLLGAAGVTGGPAFADPPAAPAHGMTAAEAAPATAKFTVPASYRLARVRIPMRDGVQLDTLILTPEDTSRSYPILMDRTPYDPTAPWLTPSPELAKARFIFVTQSVRGRYGSEGEFVQMRPLQNHRTSRTDIDESTDAFDTIDWLVKNMPHNNGRVGLWGLSYEGFFAAAGMIDAHPALKAVSPQAPQADWFAGDDLHHNGALMLATSFNWMFLCNRLTTGTRICGTGFNPPTIDGYQLFLSLGPLSNIDRQYLHGDSPEWQVVTHHATYDELWQRRNLLPHLRDIRPAVLVVSGWYDASNLYGAVHVFETLRQKSPGTSARLVLGPWTHGEWVRDGGESIGPLHFGANTATHYLQDIELPFFEAYLKGESEPAIPVASVFDTGLNRWSTFDTWPPTAARAMNLYPGSGGTLGFKPPEQNGSYDEYVSDPANPVPFVPDHGVDMEPDYMTHDQRFASNRPDVLTYESAVLSEDLTVAGPISPHLVVSTSGTDSDWVVKVIDVHPTAPSDAAANKAGGFQELVRGDVMRSKFRDSLSNPSPMKPNQPTPIHFTMLDVYHTFKKGHRILVEVQSSWFPLVDRNPQRFVDIYAAEPGDFQRATQRVFHSSEHVSRVELNVLPPAAVPPTANSNALRIR